MTTLVNSKSMLTDECAMGSHLKQKCEVYCVTGEPSPLRDSIDEDARYRRSR
ncbi:MULTISPECIES: hypothetical protein [unclassified Mesorhizobium]|uniref:hypothetical protein n=1 Tax=unclassified Mesorhizobium TaxID=325217 RepID=UPI0015E3215B|nr:MULTISPECIES: hypothetical protein [unclassified Mesorhizobium]